MKPFKVAAILGLLALGLACSRSNNLLLGEVETKVGSHDVRVTDCYRTSVDPPLETKERDGSVSYRFTPCRDADVVIRQDRLMVNGVSYGPISPDESILVDHGVVSIDGRHAPGREAHL